VYSASPTIGLGIASDSALIISNGSQEVKTIEKIVNNTRIFFMIVFFKN
jgi:hypothetical protein